MIPQSFDSFSVVIYEESLCCIALVEYVVLNDRSKHVDINFKFFMHHDRNGAVKLHYIPINKIVAAFR